MNLHTIDFNALYMQQKEQSTFKMKSKASWDKKASSMNSRVHASIYNEEFLNELNLKECETLLDVGCGVGNLSLKVALKLKTVYALDYSPQMLEYLKSNAKEQNIDNIITLEKSWYDSWEEIPSCDVVIASRSMEVKNMQEALLKLHEKAKKRVYVSYKVGGSFVDEKILKAMGKTIIKKPDYIYVVNILYALGINASVNFIRSEGRNTIYTSKEKFIESIQWSLGELTAQELQKLEVYYNNLDEVKKTQEEYVSWAVISWEK
ncbi:MAG: class I SAM-dependent methyltransferase [Deltaproteobacteria bacterium HGW-Deltaproteobacteria-24]|jgi:FkbM family methyltransferase|nr:MAG: class I SAM-dependent methyltransferase [Deltaproteobacteria bacterium HGW-Deltaproteobacteria-24]